MGILVFSHLPQICIEQNKNGHGLFVGHLLANEAILVYVACAQVFLFFILIYFFLQIEMTR